MTLPASGPISLGQVNTELNVAPTSVVSLNNPAVRTLFQVPSGTIRLSNGYGKSSGLQFSIVAGVGGSSYGYSGAISGGGPFGSISPAGVLFRGNPILKLTVSTLANGRMALNTNGAAPVDQRGPTDLYINDTFVGQMTDTFNTGDLWQTQALVRYYMDVGVTYQIRLSPP